MFPGMQETTPGGHIRLQDASSIRCAGMGTPCKAAGYPKEIELMRLGGESSTLDSSKMPFALLWFLCWEPCPIY